MPFQNAPFNLPERNEPQLLFRVPSSPCRLGLLFQFLLRKGDSDRNTRIIGIARRRRRPLLFVNNDLDGFEPLPTHFVITVANTDEGIAVFLKKLDSPFLPRFQV
jgi:hypothetical protein